MPLPKKKKLTVKQQRFVDFYDGNATDAARKAGYKGNPHSIEQVGFENLRKPEIVKALRLREKKAINPNIMSREERQTFWTKMIETSERDSDKLRASELLGKSEGDFLDRLQVGFDQSTLNVIFAALPGDAVERIKDMLAEMHQRKNGG